MGIYEHPEYYDIAFSFRDYAAEADFIEEAVRRHSRIPVRRILEIACGQCPHMQELTGRGYAYVGVDYNNSMLSYARRKASRLKANVELVEANILDFTLDEPADFACVMLGSLYVKSAAELEAHFDAMGRALRSGGLYLLDCCIDVDPLSDVASTWECERGGIHIRTTYYTALENRMEQTVRESVMLEVNDHGKHKTIEERSIRKRIYPEEFRLFIRLRPDFEFVGWWNDWSIDRPLNGEDAMNRPVVVIRRR